MSAAARVSDGGAAPMLAGIELREIRTFLVLADELRVIVVATDHTLAQQASIEWEDLAEYTVTITAWRVSPRSPFGTSRHHAQRPSPTS